MPFAIGRLSRVVMALPVRSRFEQVPR